MVWGRHAVVWGGLRDGMGEGTDPIRNEVMSSSSCSSKVASQGACGEAAWVIVRAIIVRKYCKRVHTHTPHTHTHTAHTHNTRVRTRGGSFGAAGVEHGGGMASFHAPREQGR